MSVNLLAICVGNTRTRIGAFVDGKLVDKREFANHSIDALVDEAMAAYEQVRDKPSSAALLSSVNPPVGDALREQLHKRIGGPVHRVEDEVRIPIGRQLDPEAIVGEDRLLNAAAAYDVLQQACIVVDAGTAITVDFVDGAGTFHGGAIAPGAQMMLDALHEHTAQLPEIELEPPGEAIGHNTVEAMRSGAFYGLRGMVHELLEAYAERAGAFPMVVATGGNAEMLFRDYELVERVVPDLTLMGMAVTMRVALET